MDTETKITRRKMLRNVGIAGAVAWTAPVLTSLGGPAFADVRAAGNKQCYRFAKGGGICAQCNEAFIGCAGSSSCACFVTTAGCCFCSQSSDCANLTPCRVNRDCPPGYQCAITCCGPDPLCNPPCGAAAAVPRKPGVRYSAG